MTAILVRDALGTEISLEDLIAALPDLIDASVRVAVDKLTSQPGLYYTTGTVEDVTIGGAAVQLDEDDPGHTVPALLAAAVAPGDRVGLLVSPSGGVIVIGGTSAGIPTTPATATLYIPSTVVLAAVGAGTYRIGDLSVTSVDLTATIAPGSVAVQTLRFLRDGVIIDTVTGPGAVTTFTDTTPVTTTTVYTVEIDDGSTTVTSNEARFDFVSPYFWGLSATDALGTGVSALTAEIAVEGPQAFVYTLTGTPQFMYYAQPTAYAPIVLIRDRETGHGQWPNGWKPVATVTISGVSYDVYQSSLPQSSVGGAIYDLDFASTVDAPEGGAATSRIEASQVPADPDRGLLGRNVQTQVYELADRTGPYASLYEMGSVKTERDFFIGGRADGKSFHDAGDSRSGMIGDLGWLDDFAEPGAGGSTAIAPAQAIDANALGYLEFRVAATGIVSDTIIVYRNLKDMQASPTFTVAYRVQLGTLNDGTNDVKARIGLHDATDALLPTVGFWFEYGQTDDTNWYFRTARATGGALLKNLLVAAADTDYHWFVIACDGSGDAPTVNAWIVDDIVDWVPGVTAPLATVFDGDYLPVVGDVYGPNMVVVKQAGGVQRTVRVSDYWLRVGHN